MKEEFSKKINLILEDRNISIEELSRKINVSKTTIENWVRGKSFPNRLKTILALSSYLELPLSFFWNLRQKGE